MSICPSLTFTVYNEGPKPYIKTCNYKMVQDRKPMFPFKTTGIVLILQQWHFVLCKFIEMVAILQTKFSKALWMKIAFRFKFHWSLFLRTQLDIWSICPSNELAPNRRQTITWTKSDLTSLLTHICVTRPIWVKSDLTSLFNLRTRKCWKLISQN